MNWDIIFWIAAVFTAIMEVKAIVIAIKTKKPDAFYTQMSLFGLEIMFASQYLLYHLPIYLLGTVAAWVGMMIACGFPILQWHTGKKQTEGEHTDEN